MIGIAPPETYDVREWQDHIAALRASDDYPGRDRAIRSAEDVAAIIKRHKQRTGDTPTAMDVLEAVEVLQDESR